MTNHEKTLETANPAVGKSNAPFIFLKTDLFEGEEGQKEREIILGRLTAGHRATPHLLQGSISRTLRP